MSALTEIAVLGGGRLIVCRNDAGAYCLIRTGAEGDLIRSDPLTVGDAVECARLELLGIQRHSGSVQAIVNRLSLAVLALAAERKNAEALEAIR